MKTKKTILVITLAILIMLGLTFGSFATENSDSVVTSPDISVDDSENNNQGSNESDGSGDVEIEEPNIGTDSDNNSQSGNIANDSSSNNTGNDNSGSLSTENNNSNNGYEQEVEQNESSYQEPVQNVPTQNDWQINNNNVVKNKSENADLGTLILDVEGLSPEFDKNITEYYLIVDLSIESVGIEAYPEDNNSIVMIDGNIDLQEGENVISITVKAEAGNTKAYTIYVTKTDDIDMVNANLKNLSVKGFNFYPSFKNNIYNYNLTINEKLSQLEITVEPEIEGATYEIIGNENLVEGDNLIKIIVTAKDGAAKREYKLNVFISSKNVEIQEISKTPAIALLAVLGVAIIGTAIAISKKH